MIMTSKYKNFKVIKFEEYIVTERYHNKHYITKGEYLTPGSYVMIKPNDYFEYQNDPYYGINSKMKKLCGCIFKIKKQHHLKITLDLMEIVVKTIEMLSSMILFLKSQIILVNLHLMI